MPAEQGLAWSVVLRARPAPVPCHWLNVARDRELGMGTGGNSLSICGLDRLSSEQTALQCRRNVKKKKKLKNKPMNT